eukprot:GHVT01064514.1.p1 GENE.GHVT01064514.1~~GHVT01064514.1.p1  ORF type:complete len:488 (+),score=66.20 GHVT01064514.1:277-1740(+)
MLLLETLKMFLFDYCQQLVCGLPSKRRSTDFGTSPPPLAQHDKRLARGQFWPLRSRISRQVGIAFSSHPSLQSLNAATTHAINDTPVSQLRRNSCPQALLSPVPPGRIRHSLRRRNSSHPSPSSAHCPAGSSSFSPVTNAVGVLNAPQSNLPWPFDIVLEHNGNLTIVCEQLLKTRLRLAVLSHTCVQQSNLDLPVNTAVKPTPRYSTVAASAVADAAGGEALAENGPTQYLRRIFLERPQGNKSPSSARRRRDLQWSRRAGRQFRKQGRPTGLRDNDADTIALTAGRDTATGDKAAKASAFSTPTPPHSSCCSSLSYPTDASACDSPVSSADRAAREASAPWHLTASRLTRRRRSRPSVSAHWPHTEAQHGNADQKESKAPPTTGKTGSVPTVSGSARGESGLRRVVFGILAVKLSAFRPIVRRTITEAAVPFGRLLEDFGVSRRVDMKGLWHVHVKRSFFFRPATPRKHSTLAYRRPARHALTPG